MDIGPLDASRKRARLCPRSHHCRSNQSGYNALWLRGVLPATFRRFSDIALTQDMGIVIVWPAGVFRSSDLGASWEQGIGISSVQLSVLGSADSGDTIFGASSTTGVIFQSRDGGHMWLPVADSGYRLRRIEVVNFHLVGATLFDGIIMQQETCGSCSVE